MLASGRALFDLLGGFGGEFRGFAFAAVLSVGVRKGILLPNNVRPPFGIGAIEVEPTLGRGGLAIGKDSLGWAFRHADPAINALVRMNDEHVCALVEAIYGTDFDAVRIFALDTVLGDDISHERLRAGGK
jgi:hypothetical protein